MVPYIAKVHGVSIEKVLGELDARFSHLPPYPHLRAFRAGISKTSKWTGNEFHAMIKVYMGITRDLLDELMARLLRLFTDIHRLSHYVSHTDSTIEMLANAIEKFTALRNHLEGPLVANGIIEQDWYCPKIHILQHYPEWIKAKGALPFSFTDRGEAWHKPLKASYRASNKGAQVEEFIVCEEERTVAFKLWENSLPMEDRFQTSSNGGEPSLDWDEIPEFEEGQETVPMDELPTGVKSVTFTKSRRWPGLWEVGEAEKEFKLNGLAEQTLLVLRHIEARGKRAVRLRRGDLESRGRIDIRGYNGLKVRYPDV